MKTPRNIDFVLFVDCLRKVLANEGRLIQDREQFYKDLNNLIKKKTDAPLQSLIALSIGDSLTAAQIQNRISKAKKLYDDIEVKFRPNVKFGKRKKKDELDKFYTKPEVSKKFVGKLFEFYDMKNFDVILEPSVGGGSFFFHLPATKREGIDIEPTVVDARISQMDFFDWQPQPDKKYIVVGNPPFGRISSLAIEFFQKSAEFADVIAFLIPRTFRRVSVQNKLNLDFHLVYDEEVPTKPCCFEPEMSAKCCFQIWEKRDVKRQKIELIKTCQDWEFLPFGPLDNNKQPTPPNGASFALRAYGGKCGEITSEGLEELRPKSWHWIKCKDPQILKNRFSTLDYSISQDTARQNSLGRAELVWLYKQKYEEGEINK